MLFDNYEKIKYTIGNKEVTISDIFRNISFKDVELSNAFYDYHIEDGETPELVSIKIYGTSSYSWLILLVNSIADRKNDWFESQEHFTRKRDLNYGGDAFYFSALPDLTVGDIMIKATAVSGNSATGVTANIYRHVADFDPMLRKVRGIEGAGVFANGDNVVFARKQSNGLVDPIAFDNQAETPEETDYTNILFIEPYIESVQYFYTASNVVLNPYRAGTTGYNVDTNTTYTDATPGITGNNFARTILYKYGICGGVGYAGANKFEIGTDLFNKYTDKQKIKVLRPEYLSSVVTLIKTALDSDEVGKTFKILI